jgi:hypothetical protein
MYRVGTEAEYEWGWQSQLSDFGTTGCYQALYSLMTYRCTNAAQAAGHPEIAAVQAFLDRTEH